MATEIWRFIFLPAFERLIKSGKIPKSQLDAIIASIVNGEAKTMPGSGGFKKLRFGDKKQARGKSGGWRAICAICPGGVCVAVMAMAYDKGKKGDMSRKKVNELKQFKKELDGQMAALLRGEAKGLKKVRKTKWERRPGKKAKRFEN